jgi:hypothetical protein
VCRIALNLETRGLWKRAHEVAVKRTDETIYGRSYD